MNHDDHSYEEEQFDLQQLQNAMNAHDWSQIDLQLSPLPDNPHYQVLIPNKSISIYYQRLRYILQHQSYHFSPQTLALTTYLLKSSTNNYYALMLRKKHVSNQLNLLPQNIKLETSQTQKKNILQRQLKFMNNLLEDNPKEYHVWTYKKDLISSLIQLNNKPQNQFQFLLKEQVFKRQNIFIFSLLIQDCRNYHAWDYRFWLVTFLDKIQDEFQWIDELLNVNNSSEKKIDQVLRDFQSSQLKVEQIKINWIEVNSLWSHRFNLIKYLKDHHSQSQLSQNQPQLKSNSINLNWKQLIMIQLHLALSLLKINRVNECVWNYLSGLIRFQQSQLNNQYFPKIQNLLRQLFDFSKIKFHQFNQLNRFQLTFIKNFKHYLDLSKENKQFDIKILTTLKKIDKTRNKYYDYMLRQENA